MAWVLLDTVKLAFDTKTLRHICWGNKRQNWDKDVSHQEAGYSWELILSSNQILGGELPAIGF